MTAVAALTTPFRVDSVVIKCLLQHSPYSGILLGITSGSRSCAVALAFFQRSPCSLGCCSSWSEMWFIWCDNVVRGRNCHGPGPRHVYSGIACSTAGEPRVRFT